MPDINSPYLNKALLHSDIQCSDGPKEASRKEMAEERRRQTQQEVFYLIQQIENVRERMLMMGFRTQATDLDVVVVELVKQWMKGRPHAE